MANPNVQNFERNTIIRASAILTGSYVAATIIKDCEHYNQLMLFIDYTKGSLDSFQVKIEFSDDGENFYQETYSTISGATSTDILGYHTIVAVTGKYVLSVPIKCSYIKVWAKGTGTATSSLLQIISALAVA